MPNVPISILMVDDRPENLVALRAILESPGYRLIAAASGKEALHLALREELAVILLDVIMPEMDGFEVADKLKTLDRTRHVPIIFLTASATDTTHIFKAYSSGGVDFLVKPLDPDVVRCKVAVFVDLYRQRRDLERQETIRLENERKEYALRLGEMRVASDNRYRKLIEGIDHAFGWTMDSDGRRLTFVSCQAERILGFTCDELAQPEFFLHHVPSADRERVLERLERVVEETGDQSVEHGFVAADGRRMWFHTGMSAVSREDDESPEIHGISVDVTALKRAEETQRLIADAATMLTEPFAYRTTMTTLAHLVVPRLADWCVIHVFASPNVEPFIVAHAPGHERLAHELECRPVRPETLPPAVARVLSTRGPILRRWITDAHAVVDVLGSAHPETVRTLGAKSFMVVPLQARGHVLAVMTLVSSHGGRRFGYDDLEIAQDLGARAALSIDNARLYEEAQRATLAREEVLRVVSHDLKNPLSIVLTGADCLTRMPHANDSVERREHIVETIRRAAQRMASLVDDLVDMNRVDGGIHIERSPQSAAALIEDSVQLVEPLATERSIAIEGHPEHVRSGIVPCDRKRVLQILENLLGNAVKFSPEHTRVTLDAHVRGDAVEFAVSDHGPGIPPEHLPHVFDRYWQAEPTARLGTGLGLAIAKGLVEAHGGEIWAESEVDHGTTFYFTLPMAAPAGAGD